jgi:hypothetical protein
MLSRTHIASLGLRRGSRRRAAALAVLLASWGIASAARAEGPAWSADDWRFTAILYGYLPSIGGSSSFPERTGGSNINVDSSKIFDSLNFAFMGTLEAQKGRWGVLTDVIYMDISGSKSNTRSISVGGNDLPLGTTADVNIDLKGTIWTLAGSYRLSADPAATVDVLGGARLLSIKQNLDWNFSADLGPAQPSRTGSSEIKADNWDAIVGVKGRFAFGANHEWFVPYYADVGTGESDLTWQAFGGLGYSFQWGDVVAGWRHVDYEFKSGDKLNDANLDGPMIGVAFHW